MRDRSVVLAAAIVALAVKVCLATFTYGTNDVKAWEAFLGVYNASGATALYEGGAWAMQPTPHWEPMNHPPLALTLLRVWGALEGVTGVPLRFWLRLFSSLADCASLYFLWRLVPKRWVLVIYALAPSCVFLSGYHGNTDPVVVAGVLGAVVFLPTAPMLAGVFLALGISVKIWPVVLLPAFLLHVRERVRFLGALTAAGVVFSLPYLLYALVPILKSLASYRGAPGVWGLPSIIPGYGPFGMPVLLAAVLFTTWRLREAPAVVTCGGAMAAFLAFTPGFGAQYLAWMMPWVAVMGAAPMAAFAGVTGAFTFFLYTDTAGGVPWYFSDFVLRPETSLLTAVLKLACWAVSLIVFKMFHDGVWRKAG